MDADAANRRTYERIAVNTVAWVAWNDEQGIPRKMRGRCLDVSKGGLRLQLPRYIAAGTQVTIGVPNQNWEGRAEVRHCVSANGLYSIGVKFVM